MQGLAVLRLVDFDGDGALELFCAYSSEPISFVKQQVFMDIPLGKPLFIIKKVSFIIKKVLFLLKRYYFY